MKRSSLLLACGVALTLVLSGCGIEAGSSSVDPREGWVQVEGDDIMKKCDGPTLMYRYEDGARSGFGVIPDSPECLPDEG